MSRSTDNDSNGSPSESDDIDDVDTIRPIAKRGTLDFIDERIIAALDKCKISSRLAVHLLTAVAAALGHQIDKLIVNRKSIEDRRKKYRETLSKKMKADFSNIVN